MCVFVNSTSIIVAADVHICMRLVLIDTVVTTQLCDNNNTSINITGYYHIKFTRNSLTHWHIINNHERVFTQYTVRSLVNNFMFNQTN